MLAGDHQLEPMQLLTAREAQAILRVGRTTFFGLQKKGLVRAIPQGRRRVYLRREVEQLGEGGWL